MLGAREVRPSGLVPLAVLEADVIVNLPKLKTHKKAGVTCALKNLIGINGNKEYLPHHRIGGHNLGGDCYPGGSDLKRALGFVHDRQLALVAQDAYKRLLAPTCEVDVRVDVGHDLLG